MIVLDENIVESQVKQLRRWRIRSRQIGFDLGRQGISDSEIIPLLLQLDRPTFFTEDTDFYRPTRCHQQYCLVYLAVEKHEIALFVRRFLRDARFRERSKRMGLVAQLMHSGIRIWKAHQPETVEPW